MIKTRIRQINYTSITFKNKQTAFFFPFAYRALSGIADGGVGLRGRGELVEKEEDQEQEQEHDCL